MTTEKAILAGGCFWGMQDLLRRYPGVLQTRVGYTGGDVPNATYRNQHAADDVTDRQAMLVRRQVAPAPQAYGIGNGFWGLNPHDDGQDIDRERGHKT